MAVSWQRTRTVGRTELRRRWRTLRDNPSQLLGIALMVLFLLPAVGVLVGGAYFAGSALTGDVSTPIPLARQVAVGIWLLTAVFGGIRGYTSLLDPDNRDGLLTTISHGQLLAGLFAAEATVLGVPTVIVLAFVALAFAVGSGSLIAAPVVFVTATLLAATGFATGVGVALLVKNGGVRSQLLYRLRTVVFVAGFLAYFAVLFSNSTSDVLGPLIGVLTPTPIGWVGEVALLAAGAAASLARAAVGLVVVAGGLVVGAPVLTRLAGWLWYADGLETTKSTATPTDATSGRLLSWLPQPIAGVVTADWTRARRAPISLSYAIYPVFVLVTPIMETVQTGSVAGSFPVLVAFCGAWITGALFTLNVVGNEGAVLPATVLSPAPARALVGGHIAAGALAGLPTTALAVTALGIAGPQSLTTVATLTAGTVVVAGCAGPIATGIGAAFPRHEAVSVSRSRKAIIPSTFAFVIYSLVVSIVALPLLITHTGLISHLVSDVFGISPTVFGGVGVGITAVLGVAFGLFSFLYARRTVEGYRME